MHHIWLLLPLVLIIGLGNAASTNIELPPVILEKAPVIQAPPPNTEATDPADPEVPGPIILKDLPTYLLKLQAAFKWLITYKYYEGDPSKVDQDNEEVLAEVIIDALNKMKKFYKLTANGKLDNDVLDEMTPPRCGESDLPGRSKRQKRWSRLGNILWKNFPVLLKYRGYGDRMSQRDQEDALKHCARLWGDNSGLTFRIAKDYEPGNIEIIYKYIDGLWNTIGTGQSPVPYRHPPTSMLTLDSSERFKMSRHDPGQGVSLKWALCHEMGHTLGLSHSHDRDAIMYPSGNGQDENNLSSDDRTGIQALYGPPNGKGLLGDNERPQPPSRPLQPRPSRPIPQPRPPRPTRQPRPSRPTRQPRPSRPIRRRRPPPPRRAPAPQRPQTYWPPRTTRRRPNYAPVGYKPNYRPSSIKANLLPWYV